MAIDFPRSKYTAAEGASDNTPAWPNPPSSGDTRTNSAGHTFNWNVGKSLWILATDTSHSITNGPTYSWDGEKWIAQSAIPFRYHGALASDPTGLSASDEGDLYFNSTNDDLRVYDGSSWNTIAGNAVNVSTVAGISSDVTTVAGISADVTTVANDGTDIGTVAGISSDVSTVAGVATEIGRLGTADAVADMNLLGTADAVSDMNTLGTADVVSDMNTLATSANVTAMSNCSDDISNINTVAGSISNVNTVAGRDAEIGRLGTADAVADMNLLGTADVVADMALLGTADCVADMALLGTTDVISDMNTLAVSDVLDDMETCANNNANITNVGDDITNVNTVAGDLTNIGTCATNIANINTAATNIADVNNFVARYRFGPTDPTTNNDDGDLFYNTNSDTLKVWDGSAWTTAATGTSGFITTASGGTMAANIDFADTHKVTGLAAPTDNNDAARKKYVDDEIAGISVPDTNLSYTASSRVLASSTGTNATLPEVVASGNSGLMTGSDKNKLDGIASGAEVNVATNLSVSTTATTNVIASSTGTNATIGEATGSAAGLMSTTHHNKLDGIASGAEVNVQSDWNASSGDAAILNKPTIPTNNNQLTNGAGYITSADGGNADTVDSLHASSFVRSDANDTCSGEITFTSGIKVSGTFSGDTQASELVLEGDSPTITFSNTGTSQDDFYLHVASNNFYVLCDRDGVAGGWDSPHPLQLEGDTNNAYVFGNTIWHAGNDGSGSGLDADTVDGIQASNFLRSNTSDTASGDINFSGGAAACNISANSDIRLATGTWTGETNGKIQHSGNAVYIQGGSNGIIFRKGNTAVNFAQFNNSGHFMPTTNNAYDLGATSNRWRNVYTNDLNLSNEGSANDVDGTWGNYTIQEGEKDLFLINRRNGKKYKFNLTEV